jgi:UPF0716 protein FxsA
MFFRLLALFISIPVIELYLFLLIGARIGVLATLAIIVITGILGASLSRAQGLKTLVRYQQALAEGRLPHREVIEGLMILAAGVLLLTPGFLTDAIGFALLVPAIRDAVREKLTAYLSARIRVVGAGMPTPPHPTDPETVRRVYRETGVIEIEAEVVEESPPKG